jgi:hypothetical protein
MKTVVLVLVALTAALSRPLVAQEAKPVPKDSVRVYIPGCSKGYVFTAGPRTEDQPRRSDIPEGTHLRMNGPKELMAEIKAHEGTMIEITGLIKKGQYGQDGVRVGGARITPGLSPDGDSALRDTSFGQIMIDVEGWRPVAGLCRSR